MEWKKGGHGGVNRNVESRCLLQHLQPAGGRGSAGFKAASQFVIEMRQGCTKQDLRFIGDEDVEVPFDQNRAGLNPGLCGPLRAGVAGTGA